MKDLYKAMSFRIRGVGSTQSLHAPTEETLPLRVAKTGENRTEARPLKNQPHDMRFRKLPANMCRLVRFVAGRAVPQM